MIPEYRLPDHTMAVDRDHFNKERDTVMEKEVFEWDDRKVTLDCSRIWEDPRS